MIMAGLLDNLKNMAQSKYQQGLLYQLTNSPQNVKQELVNLFNPQYMSQVQGITPQQAQSIAMDINPMMALTTKGYGTAANEIASILSKNNPNIDATLVSGDNLILSKIIAKNKNLGYGTNYMNELVNLADKRNLKTALTPSKDFGGDVNKLKEFYKRFGFVENKGKNKDFSISEYMYRNPKNKLIVE